jgi:hypothetical protein
MKKMLAFLLVFALSIQALATGSTDGRPSTATPNPGVKNAADNSKKNNDSGSKAAQNISMGLMAGGLAASAACSSQVYSMCPVAPVLFGLSMLAGMQSKSNKKTAGEAFYAGGDTYGGGDPYGPGSLGYNPYSAWQGDPEEKLTDREREKLDNYNKALAALTSDQGLNGFKFNKKTGILTTPDGKKFKIADFESEAAMKAAGIPDSMIKGAMDKAKKLEAEALGKAEGATAPVATGFQEGSGGAPGGMGKVGDGSEGVDGGTEGGGKGRGLADGKTPGGARGVAGLSKNFNGDPIGVAQDGLFLMMARRYKVKEKQDSFFSDADLIQK